MVRPDQKVLPVLVLGQKSAVYFCPTHPVLVQPGLAVAVTGYPQVILMRAHWIAIYRALGELMMSEWFFISAFTVAIPDAMS